MNNQTIQPEKIAALISICLALLAVTSMGQDQAFTEPCGYVKISITPGTGVVKRTTLFSIPLIGDFGGDGSAVGRISGVLDRTITCEGAGWTPGQLSSVSEPYLIEVTSGMAAGRMILISTDIPNTHETVTVTISELGGGALSGIKGGDSYAIRPVDTLGTLFGTPETTRIHGGPNAREADTITMVVNGAASTYFYNTGAVPPCWSRVSLGTPNASNTPIPPYAGLQYSRISSEPLDLLVTGKVPYGIRKTSVKNSGSTLLSSFWAQEQTLSAMGIHNVQGWRSGSTGKDADTILLLSGGAASTYFYDGANWRKVSFGSPVADSTMVAPGAGLLITRKGVEAGSSFYAHQAPYILD